MCLNVTLKYGGTRYAVNSLIKVLGSHLGGEDGVNDLIITVTGIDGGGAGSQSSYLAGSIIGINWTGVSTGSGSHIVSGSNYSGTVDYISIE